MFAGGIKNYIGRYLIHIAAPPNALAYKLMIAWCLAALLENCDRFVFIIRSIWTCSAQ